MQLSRIHIVFYVFLLSACASADKRSPAVADDISLRSDAGLTTARAKPSERANVKVKPATARRIEPMPDVTPENNVFFASGDVKVDERGQELLRRHATRLKDNPQQVITLVGYTDPLGSPSYNLALAEERLDSVVEILRSLGVARGQIRRVNTGQAQGGSDCDSPACRQQMRRVELIYDN